MRQPGLHITENILGQILKELLEQSELKIVRNYNHILVIRVADLEIKINSKEKTLKANYIDKLAKAISIRASNYTLTSRKLSINTKGIEKKLSKVTNTNIDNSLTFSNLLVSVRRKHFHKGIIQIKPGSKEWGMVKEVSVLATEFCHDFKLVIRNGFIIYIDLALTKMGKFTLNKFQSLHNDICSDYQAILNIKSDPNPKQTEKLHIIYTNTVYRETGLYQNYDKYPQKYMCFVEVAKECQRLGIDPEVYIKSQFEGLAWTKSIPDPQQLIGDKALIRLNKYLYQNKISIAKKPKLIDWGKIKGDA